MTPRSWLLPRLAIPAFLFILSLGVLFFDRPQPGAVEALSGGGQIFFYRGILAGATIGGPTSLAFGPDGRLYAASEDEIRAFTLDPATKQVLASEQIATGLADVTGIAFDPTAAPSPVILYASRRNPDATEGYEGVVSRFTGPTWGRQDVITGLPNSRPFTNHFTNGLAFDNQGRLFIAQGSMTDTGLAGPYYPEVPLSAAILIADIHAPGFNGAVAYSPAGTPTDDNVNQVSGNVSVFAAGLRNPYDLVLHSNGYIYATDNAPNPAATSLSCTTEGGTVNDADELNLIEQGNYYGFPNRNRGRFDARQCAYRAPEDGDGNGATGPIAILPDHCSCDGIAEYTSLAFNGAMTGDLLVARLIYGEVSRTELSLDGRSAVSTTILADTFQLPLDVLAANDGTIYVAEYGADRIAVLAPDSDRDGCADPRETGLNQVVGGRRNPKNFWDFFDTPGMGDVRDRAVTIGDISRVVSRFGSFGTATTVDDALAPAPAAPAYHAGFDRTPSTIVAEPWRTNAANGAITIQDIALAVQSFGNTCV